MLLNKLSFSLRKLKHDFIKMSLTAATPPTETMEAQIGNSGTTALSASDGANKTTPEYSTSIKEETEKILSQQY